MKTAALILNWNRAELTEQAALSIRDQVDRVMVIDNGSEDEQCKRLDRFCVAHDLQFVDNVQNLGYAAGNNRGIELALAEGYEGIVVMNNDATAEPGAVAALQAELDRDPSIGVVTPTVLEMRTGRVVHTTCKLDWETGEAAWLGLGTPLDEIARSKPQETGYVSGEAFLSRAEVFRQCGLFNERLGLYYEDVEWSVRLVRAGWRLVWVPSSSFRHMVKGSKPSTRGEFYRARNHTIFLRTALGQSRLASFRYSARSSLMAIGGLVRRMHAWTAVRGVLYGWIMGLLMRDGP
jgi:GT2 family glycosyltransferase